MDKKRLLYGLVGGIIGVFVGFLLSFIYSLFGPMPMSGGNFFGVLLLTIFVVPLSIIGNCIADKRYIYRVGSIFFMLSSLRSLCLDSPTF
jgi:hypothetical protein